jgi:hypothetical protein
MGFTIVGPNHFLASGHPGPHDEGQPSNLGLIEPEEERRHWCFHVMVSDRYADWRQSQTIFPQLQRVPALESEVAVTGSK